MWLSLSTTKPSPTHYSYYEVFSRRWKLHNSRRLIFTFFHLSFHPCYLILLCFWLLSLHFLKLWPHTVEFILCLFSLFSLPFLSLCSLVSFRKITAVQRLFINKSDLTKQNTQRTLTKASFLPLCIHKRLNWNILLHFTHFTLRQYSDIQSKLSWTIDGSYISLHQQQIRLRFFPAYLFPA